MGNSQNIIFHICMNSKYKRRKKENINVRKMFTSLSKLKTMGVISQIRKRLLYDIYTLYSACYQVYERKKFFNMK
jgi:hypothetical protein